MIGERGSKKRRSKRRRRRRTRRSSPSTRAREKTRPRSCIFLSPSPSQFGTLAKTLLRFKSVPFGKVPTLSCEFSRNISPIAGNISRGLHRFSPTPALLSRETCQRVPLQKLHCESIQAFIQRIHRVVRGY